MLGAVGLVLDAGAGWTAAELGHGLHEPTHHRSTSCKQVKKRRQMRMPMMVKMMMDWLGLQGRGGGVWEGGLYPIPLICFYVMTMSNAHSGDLESAQSVEPV